MYVVHFGSPRSIYCHVEPPTHLYLLTHAFVGLFNAPEDFTNVCTLVCNCLGCVGAPLVHLGGIEVKYYHDTCTLQLAP